MCVRVLCKIYNRAVCTNSLQSGSERIYELTGINEVNLRRPANRTEAFLGLKVVLSCDEYSTATV
jgi:hypothetical protein